MLHYYSCAGHVVFGACCRARCRRVPDDGDSVRRFTIALLQMLPHANDLGANRDKAVEYCRTAAAMGADLALFPEIWSTGYTEGFDAGRSDARDLWIAQAQPVDGDYVAHFRRLAVELDMAIACTYLQEWDPVPRNSVTLVDRHGEIVFTYAKVHTCDFFPMEAACAPGDDFHVGTLDTSVGPVQIGAMICYDREHPESARVLMLKGAEIIITPNACGLEELRLGQFQARAFENAVGLAMTNYPDGHCNGHSIAYDAAGRLIVEAGGAEGVYLAPFDLDALRDYRAKTVWGNAFRRPHRYAVITDPDVAAPFDDRRDGHGKPWERTQR
ncbi:MAG: carbon-nitrogen hydrolase family protein [Spirochaetaceae bacterium]|nr:MAG: carbon-nitrogen hydrolase family protein [Spirochaetaceae bacterium]